MTDSHATFAIRSRRRAGESGLAAGLRASHLLGAADFEPPSLPPAATLVVRRLNDPSPRNLQPDPGALLAGAVWQRTARSALDGLCRNAVRPARGPVPLNAESVLFADQAELLACLSRDLVAGVAHSLWWWRAILRSLPAGRPAALYAAWSRDPTCIPPALSVLAAHGLAPAVVASFTPAEAWSLLEFVARAYDLRALLAVPDSPPDAPRSNLENESEPGAQAQPPVPGGAAISGPVIPSPLQAASAPWRALLPAGHVPEHLGMERAALLGIGLALQAAPSTVRSSRFARAFSSWRRRASREFLRDTTNPPPRPDSPASPAGPWQDERHAPVEDRTPAPVEAARLAGAIPEGLREADRFAPSLTPDQPGPAEPQRRSPLEATDCAAMPAPEDAASESPAGQSRSETPAISQLSPEPSGSRLVSEAEVLEAPLNPPVVRPLAPPPGDADFGEPVLTEIGGALFLVSMLKALRLPFAVEESCGCELGLGSWELVELIARCLLGPRDAHLAGDPIWKALAVLDGRAPQRPAGGDFTGAASYRLPPSWMDELPRPGNRAGIRLRDGRLQVWHPLGLLLEDHESGAPLPSERPLWPATRYARPWSGCAPLGIAASLALRRFLAFLMPFLRWRLARSLGRRQVSHRRLAATVLLRPATLWLTGSHVDLVMDLSQASGPIRLSGLDTDPGWVAAFGRVVQFHYRAIGVL